MTQNIVIKVKNNLQSDGKDTPNNQAETYKHLTSTKPDKTLLQMKTFKTDEA